MARGFVIFVHALVDGVSLVVRGLPVLALCGLVGECAQIVFELESFEAGIEQREAFFRQDALAPRPFLVELLARVDALHEAGECLVMLVLAGLFRRAFEAAVAAVDDVDDGEQQAAAENRICIVVEPAVGFALAGDDAHEDVVAEEPVEIRSEAIGRRIGKAETVADFFVAGFLRDAVGAQILEQGLEREVVAHVRVRSFVLHIERTGDARADIGEFLLEAEPFPRVDGHAHRRVLDGQHLREELGVEMLDVRDDDGTARGDEPCAVMRVEIAQRRPGIDIRAEGDRQHALSAEMPQRAKDAAIKLRVLRRKCRRNQKRDGLAAPEVAEEAFRVVVIAARIVGADAETCTAGRAAQGINGNLRLAALDVRDACAHRRADADALIAADAVFICIDEAFFLHPGPCFLSSYAFSERLFAQTSGVISPVLLAG